MVSIIIIIIIIVIVIIILIEIINAFFNHPQRISDFDRKQWIFFLINYSYG